MDGIPRLKIIQGPFGQHISKENIEEGEIMSRKLELDLSYDYEGNKLDHPFKVLIDHDKYGILIKFKDLPHSFHEHDGWSDRESGPQAPE